MKERIEKQPPVLVKESVSEVYGGIPNLLEGDEKEQAEKLAEFLEPYRKLSIGEVKESFIDTYHEFIKGVLKGDNKDFSGIDPYEFVTGKKFEEMYRRSNPYIHTHEQVFAPFTIIGSTNLTFKELGTSAPEHIKFNFNISEPVKFPSSGREISFGFTNTKLENDENVNIGFGTLLLDDEVVSAVREYPELKDVQYKLQQLGVWFNHDMTAHATLMPGGAQREHLYSYWSMTRAKELYEFFNAKTFNYQHKDVFAGEFWSMSLQSDIYNRIVEQRPAVGRFMRMHLKSYLRSVEALVSHVEDEENRRRYYDYLQKAYAFMFLRLVNPETIFEEGKFKDFKEGNEEFFEAPNYELMARDNAHNAHGLKFETKGEKGFVSHKELVTEIAKPLEEMELFETGLTRIRAGGKSDDVANYIRESEYNRRTWLHYLIKNCPELRRVGFTREGREEVVRGTVLVDLASGKVSLDFFFQYLIDNFRL